MLMLKRCRYDKESIEVEKGGTEEQQFAQFYNQWFNYYVNLYSLVVGTVMVFFIYYFRKQRRLRFHGNDGGFEAEEDRRKHAQRNGD